MRLPNTYLNRLADKLLSKQGQAQALKKIAQRKDWKAQVKKCHDRVTTEYKFWLSKAENLGKNAKLKDLTKDIAFIKSIESKDSISSAEHTRLQEIINKYNIN